MARVGINRQTGKLLSGWDHCLQSITNILTTEVGERVQRRDFGSNLQSMIDLPQNVETVISLYVATVEALEPREVEGKQLGEPGFVLTRVNLEASTPGLVNLYLSGVYFENGHLGDYSSPVQKDVTLSLDVVAGG